MNSYIIAVLVGAAGTIIAAPFVSAIAAFRPKQKIVWAERETRVKFSDKNAENIFSVHKEMFLQNLSWFASGDVELRFSGEMSDVQISRHRISLLGRKKAFSSIDVSVDLKTDGESHKLTLHPVEGRTQFNLQYGAFNSFSCATLKTVNANGRIYEIGQRDFGLFNSNFRSLVESFAIFGAMPLLGFALTSLAIKLLEYFGLVPS